MQWLFNLLVIVLNTILIIMNLKAAYKNYYRSNEREARSNICIHGITKLNQTETLCLEWSLTGNSQYLGNNTIDIVGRWHTKECIKMGLGCEVTVFKSGHILSECVANLKGSCVFEMADGGFEDCEGAPEEARELGV